METSAESVKLAKEVINDIFTLTGQKTDLSEPTVAAALIFSRVVRQAGADAAAEIKAAAVTLQTTAQQQTATKQDTPNRAQATQQPPHQETTWPTRLAKAVALIAVGAAVGGGVGRLMPMQYGGQALDLALASAVKHQLMQEGGNGTLWRTLGQQAQNAAIAAMGH